MKLLRFIKRFFINAYKNCINISKKYRLFQQSFVTENCQLKTVDFTKAYIFTTLRVIFTPFAFAIVR
jgi:hypothetical protein